MKMTLREAVEQPGKEIYVFAAPNAPSVRVTSHGTFDEEYYDVMLADGGRRVIHAETIVEVR